MDVSEYMVTRTLPKELEKMLSSEEGIQKRIQLNENKDTSCLRCLNSFP